MLRWPSNENRKTLRPRALAGDSAKLGFFAVLGTAGLGLLCETSYLINRFYQTSDWHNSWVISRGSLSSGEASSMLSIFCRFPQTNRKDEVPETLSLTPSDNRHNNLIVDSHEGPANTET